MPYWWFAGPRIAGFVVLACIPAALFVFGVERADAAPAGQIIKEARCKVLIRSGLPVKQGDVLAVVRRSASSPQDAVVGQVSIVKATDSRLIGKVIEPRTDCRKLLGAYISARTETGGQPSANGASSKPAVKRPPPPVRAIFSAGPAIVSATLKGISRATAVETYPLVLSAAQVSGEIFPFSFLASSAEPRQADAAENIFGIEGAFRFIAALNDVRVTLPSAATGEEIELDLRVNRTSGRIGALFRYPIWKGRLFVDARTGYTANKLVSGISKFVKAPPPEKQTLEISPLRDMSLAGFYALGGFQFQPVDKFRARLNAGTLFGANYFLDNRLADAAANATVLTTPVSQPSLFVLEASFNYLFGSMQIGLDLSVESLSGRALFPDGKNEGTTAEVYSGYGLNLAFLL